MKMTQIEPTMHIQPADKELVEQHPWILDVVRGIKGQGANQYLSTFRMWREFVNENYMPIQGDMGFVFHITPANIDAFLDPDTMSVSTARNRFAHMKRLVKYLKAEATDEVRSKIQKMSDQLDMYRIDASKFDAPAKREALTSDQVAKLLQYHANRFDVWGIRDHALITLLFATGTRINEVLNARWSDYNPERRTLYIRDSKGGFPRDASIMHRQNDKFDAIVALEGWMKILKHHYPSRTMQGQYIFLPIHSQSKKPMLDKQYSYASVWAHFNKVSEELGFNVTSHLARKTVATELWRKGYDIAVIMAQGGWRSSKTVFNNYIATLAAEERSKIVLD
jgi:integrase